MKYLLIIIFIFFNLTVFSQQVIPLYDGKIPNSKTAPNREERQANALVDSLALNVSVPTLSVFIPEKPNGAAVIICPGGGYGVLLIKREGNDVARAFNALGITAFVVKYRLPNQETMEDQAIGPLQDAQRAIQIVRNRAKEWHIDPQKIGIMGFSAGGHLAATAGTHFAKSYLPEAKKSNLRPDFMLLINPVISFNDRIGHAGSKENLLGKSATAEQIQLFSNETQITGSTPPAFLIHTGTDVVVPVENSLEFYKNMQENGVPAAIHIYSKGEHGFLTYPVFSEWFGRCIVWMRSMKFIPAS